MKWVRYDKILKKRHTQTCHNGIAKFKKLDDVIAFWLKNTVRYVVGSVDHDTLTYKFFGVQSQQYKEVDFITAEQNCKLMDKIYELLYV